MKFRNLQEGEILIPLQDEFEGYYISNFGRVYSTKRSFNNFLKNSINSQNQYFYVNLCKKGAGQQKKYIHRLVAEAFIPNPNNLPFVNHKDENRQNNSISNLEWCTPRYNTIYGTGVEKGKQTKIKNNSQYTCKIRALNPKDKKEIYQFNSITEASEFLGKTKKGISNIGHALRDRESHLAYGYYWEYCD